jgi:hypothetical protein
MAHSLLRRLRLAGLSFGDIEGQGIFTLTVSPTQITALYGGGFDQSWTSSSFNGFSITDLTNNLPVFTVSSSSLLGFSDANLSQSGNQLFVNWEGLSFTSGDEVVLSSDSAAPLPAALPLFGSGVMMLAGFAWQRRGKVS